ncbi:primosomal protein N' [Agromyces sp. LHK192]|uniref:primosomal protein N' family DNA-binding protein n=1 Tax=Agromyces sp. LHK192 TaxID=2498704 RepID=UPI001F0C7713|nr:primosomal protein N' [Agromyces sp. LHK192]
MARVLLDSPLPQLDQLFDYRVPDRLVDRVRRGMRVRVPLRTGGRIADGWVVELTHRSEYGGRLSEVEDVVGEVPLLTEDVWRLARVAADRAAGNASDILRLAIPSRYVRVERTWLQRRDEDGDGDGREPGAGGRSAGPGVVGHGAGPSSAPPTAGAAAPDLAAGIVAGARMALMADPRPLRLASGTWVGAWAFALAEAARIALDADRSTLIAVPDHRDQEQLQAALEAVIDPDRVLRTDARQSGGERYRAFLDAMRDRAHVIIGNRSTVYAPAARLGLIAIFDDGDPLHAEPLAPGVHARDAALIRQEQSGAALLFVGHTRSVDVARLVGIGWVREVEQARIQRPRVVLTEQQQTPEPGSARIPSVAWRQAQQAILEGPVLVQVARPGHTPMLVCDRCREPARCPACAGPLVLPTADAPPSCALCGTSAAGRSCPICESTKLRAATVGATRTAEELGRAFPRARVVLADGERQVLRVGDEPALVVATRGAEPIADGGYRAVLLLDGDRMLLRESLRVAEDCLRWWSNAAALAAPGAPVSLVGVGGALGTALATWRQREWAVDELAARREVGFPPAVRMASVVAASERLAGAVEATRRAVPSVEVLGPTPVDGGLERVVLRFDYGAGPTVAATLKAEAIRTATERRRPVAGRGPGRAAVLRVRFDDPDLP